MNVAVDELRRALNYARDRADNAEAKVARLRERQRADEDQLVWLSSWCKKRYGVDTNALIGKEGWPHRLAEVVAKAVEDHESSDV